MILLKENAELRRALLTPLYPAKERKAVLGVIADRMGLSPLLRNFTLLPGGSTQVGGLRRNC